MFIFILLMIGFIFIYFLLPKQNRNTYINVIPKKIEYFEEKQTPSEENINTMLKKAKNDINNNKNDWTVYNASKNKTNYILTKKNEIAIIYKSDIKSENGKPSYTINDNNDKYTGTRGFQNGADPLSTYGKFENTIANIDYKRGNKRININIGSNQTIITGYGGFSNEITYSSPWDKVIPIVYVEGGTTIGVMDYSGNKKDVISSTSYLPLEIIVSKKNEKYLPLFFEVYVLIQEYISSLK